MSDHPNVARAHEYLETFDRGDLEALRPYFSDGIIWHVAGKHALSGDYHGKEAVMAYLARAQATSSGSLNVTPTAIMANDNHIAMFVRVTGERNGKRLDIEMAEAFSIEPDGTWSEFYSMPDNQDHVDAFWA